MYETQTEFASIHPFEPDDCWSWQYIGMGWRLHNTAVGVIPYTNAVKVTDGGT